LLLLDKEAAPAAIFLEEALEDPADEVKIIAAWTLVKIGRIEQGLGCLRKLLNEGSSADRSLYNVLDWMDEDALPLVKEYLASKPGKVDGIIARIAHDHGIELKPAGSRKKR
jgi:hypothetical protein